jgi:hypothetical protein
MKEDINPYDWRKSPSQRWPYKSIDDPKYIKDRNKLFSKSGNGWWWYQGTILGKFIGKDINAEQESKSPQKGKNKEKCPAESAGENI